jgi:hypothetical protein
MEYTLLEKPLSTEEQRKQYDEDGVVTGVVPVRLSSIVENDPEATIELISQKLIGNPFLSYVAYQIVGFDFRDAIVGERLHLLVSGEPVLEEVS